MTSTAVTGEQESAPVLGLGSIHHISLTVTDLEFSVGWYKRVLGARAVAEEFHPGGKAIILVEPHSGIGVDFTGTRQTRARPSVKRGRAWTMWRSASPAGPTSRRGSGGWRRSRCHTRP